MCAKDRAVCREMANRMGEGAKCPPLRMGPKRRHGPASGLLVCGAALAATKWNQTPQKENTTGSQVVADLRRAEWLRGRRH